MNKIGNYLLKLRNKYFTKSTEGIARDITDYQKAANIGILFHLKPEEDHQALNNFVHGLEKEHKHITALAFFDIVGSNPYNFQFDFFQKRDINSLGIISSPQVAHFMSEPFDYLFCITLEDFPPFDTIMLGSQAKYRVGIYQETKESCFDLMIELPENKKNISNLIQEMWRYTKLLSKISY